MTKIIDISVELSRYTVKWPESIGYQSRAILRIEEGEEANVSAIEMDVHCGTHIDAPLHFINDGKTIDAVPLSKMVGRCYVKDCGEANVITDKHVAELPSEATKVLFKTTNSKFWADNRTVFEDRFVALNLEGAKALAQREVDIVGVDYLSIQGFYEHNDTHRVLLAREIVLLESINLTDVEEGWYDLYCLPLKIYGLEAAPCRAILIANE